MSADVAIGVAVLLACGAVPALRGFQDLNYTVKLQVGMAASVGVLILAVGLQVLLIACRPTCPAGSLLTQAVSGQYFCARGEKP